MGGPELLDGMTRPRTRCSKRARRKQGAPLRPPSVRTWLTSQVPIAELQPSKVLPSHFCCHENPLRGMSMVAHPPSHLYGFRLCRLSVWHSP